MTTRDRTRAADDLTLETVRFEDPRVQVLVDEVQAHYVAVYGSPDESVIEPGEFAPPRGRFVLGTVGGRPAAMGGWRRRPDLGGTFPGVGVAEVKRMYVAAHARRRGLARLLLAHLEVTAREDGVGLLVLETGTKQPEAIALYESAGYEPAPAFGNYAASPYSRYYARRLGDDRPA